MPLQPTMTRGGEAAPAAFFAAFVQPPRLRVPFGPAATAIGHGGCGLPRPGGARPGIDAGVSRPCSAAGSAGRVGTPYGLLPRQDSTRPIDAARAGGKLPDGDAGMGETVLMVEDEAVVRMVAADVLRDLGYRVLEASDGLAALDLMHSDERVDLLLTDMGLPGMDGRRLAEAARRLRPGLRVLFVTGEGGNAVGEGSLPPGTAVVGKPVALDALAAKVRAMLAA